MTDGDSKVPLLLRNGEKRGMLLRRYGNWWAVCMKVGASDGYRYGVGGERRRALAPYAQGWALILGIGRQTKNTLRNY